MKNLLKKSLFTLAIICFGYGAFAQLDQVTGGTSQTLTGVHTDGDTFLWTIIGNVSGPVESLNS